MAIEVDVRFSGVLERLVEGVQVSVPPGKHEIAFQLRTVDGSANAVFEAPYIVWDSGPPPGAGNPEPGDGRQLLRLVNHNRNPGPDSQTFGFQFIVTYETVTLQLGNPDPAIINEPPVTP